mgnify:CR=1 FL=1
MIDFALTPELQALQQKVRTFIAEQIIPMESDPRQGPHGPEESLRLELVAKARQAGLLSPHADPEYGGLGLSHAGRAIVFEESGYSTLGPIAMNIFAPDEGNMHLLHEVATPAQKERWLRPLVEGRIRSCFCMTEPAPGAGSDPSLLATTAEPDGEGWLISGRKWLITGADGASLKLAGVQTKCLQYCAHSNWLGRRCGLECDYYRGRLGQSVQSVNFFKRGHC